MSLVYLDSCVFVAAFEAQGPATISAVRLLETLDGRKRAVTSELTLAELLAPIARPGSLSTEKRRAMYFPLLEDERFVQLMPVDRAILLDTVELRASHPQRLPDAIHIATALRGRCRFFASFDRDARRLPSSLSWATLTSDDIATITAALDD